MDASLRSLEPASAWYVYEQSSGRLLAHGRANPTEAHQIAQAAAKAAGPPASEIFIRIVDPPHGAAS